MVRYPNPKSFKMKQLVIVSSYGHEILYKFTSDINYFKKMYLLSDTFSYKLF